MLIVIVCPADLSFCRSWITLFSVLQMTDEVSELKAQLVTAKAVVSDSLRESEEVSAPWSALRFLFASGQNRGDFSTGGFLLCAAPPQRCMMSLWSCPPHIDSLLIRHYPPFTLRCISFWFRVRRNLLFPTTIGVVRKHVKISTLFTAKLDIMHSAVYVSDPGLARFRIGWSENPLRNDLWHCLKLYVAWVL